MKNKIWVCNECGAEFEIPAKRLEDDELRYGEICLCCPMCDSLDIDEVEYEE